MSLLLLKGINGNISGRQNVPESICGGDSMSLTDLPLFRSKTRTNLKVVDVFQVSTEIICSQSFFISQNKLLFGSQVSFLMSLNVFDIWAEWCRNGGRSFTFERFCPHGRMSALNPVPEDPQVNPGPTGASLFHDQLHKPSENLKLQNRQRKRNRNLSSFSCGGPLHSDAAVMSAQSLKDAAARMKPEEEIYVNLKELVHPEPGGAGETGVRNRQQEPETGTPLKVAAVVLALLSLVLLVLAVWVSVVYNRDFSQLSGELTNRTAEKNQLQSRNQNLTEEVYRLESQKQNLTEEMDRLESRINRLENGVICPHGWRRFGCSCYWFSTSCRNWQNSRQNCLNQQADLVIINGREEMEFLNKLGVGLKFWIGLRKNLMQWTWTNDRSPSPDFWQSGHPVWRTQWNQWNQRNQASLQDCGAFNSFQTGSFYYPIKSWSSELCSACLQSVCEKEAVPSGLL